MDILKVNICQLLIPYLLIYAIMKGERPELYIKAEFCFDDLSGFQ